MSSRLSERLHEEAERVPAVLPLATEVRHAAERARLARRTIAGTLVVAVVVVVAVGATLRTHPDATPLPGTPAPNRGVYTLAADPLLTGAEWGYTRAGTEPDGFMRCIASDASLGADEVRAARYIDTKGAEPVREVVLRFGTVSGAERGYAEIRDRFSRCPNGSSSGIPMRDSSNGNIWAPGVVEADLRGEAVSGHDDYRVVVGRVGNVIVALETLNGSSDRSSIHLTRALGRAIQSL